MTDNIVIYGMDELNHKLERISGDLKTDLKRATEKAVLYVHGQVPPYPSPPAGSTYRQTGTLGRSITTEVRSIGSETVGVIGTSIVYAPYVISDRAVGKRGPQAWMHQGRWWTLQGVILKARGAVVQIFRDAIHKLVES